ncbi:MAG: GIY-YIG nuclease family protein [Deinococcales bacterium]
MGIAARWRRLDRLPARRGRDVMPGVYQLADTERRIIYVGQSARDVPNRIRQHLAARSCVAERAAFWRYAYSRVPQAEEAALLAEHRQRHGAMPECNRQEPLERDGRRRARERFSGR